MKKLVLLLLIIFPNIAFALQNNIENAVDGGSRAIGNTIDTRIGGNTAAYKTYEATLTTNRTIDIYTALGRFGSAGSLVNDGPTNNITISFSVDGTNFGDASTVKPNECFNFDRWLIFKAIRLGYSADATYRLIVR